MPASAQPATAARPYAVLYLPELVNGTAQRERLFMPLTLAYLLSMHVRFCLPVAEDAVPMVESIFDQVLNGHSLESKGIVYEQVAGEALKALVGDAVLVISSEGAAKTAGLEGLPHAVVCQTAAGYAVKLRNVEKLVDEELKGKLVGCCQLINIQSGGFVTQGHFSLSW